MKLFFFFFVFCLSISVKAQDRVGNGGGLWTCNSSGSATQGMLMDLFEARAEFKLETLSTHDNEPFVIVNERLGILKKIAPSLSKEWEIILNKTLPKITFVTEPLQEIQDSFPRIKPGPSDSCHQGWEYTQFANFTHLGHVLISQKLWENPNIQVVDKAALIWHEVIYRWFRETQKEKDSVRTRVAVGLIFSTLPDAEMKLRLESVVKPLPDPVRLPRIQLRSPSEGAILSGNQMIVFSVEASLEVQPRVYIHIDDGALVGAIPMAPYQYNLDTRRLSNGKHQLYGVVVTLEGQVKSNVLNIEVKN